MRSDGTPNWRPHSSNCKTTIYFRPASLRNTAASSSLLAEEGEVRARAAGRLFYAHEVGGQLPAVGDWVAVTPPATIASILPRRSAFIRKNAGQDSTEQVLAANVDTAFLLAGLDDDFSLRRLERYITIAWESGAAADHRADQGRPLLRTSPRRCSQSRPSRSACRSIPSRTSRAMGSLRSSTTSSLVEPSSCSARPVSASRRCSTGSREKRSCARVTSRPTEPGGTRRRTVSSSSSPAAGSSIDTPGLRELQFWEGDLSAAFEDIEALALECTLPRTARTHSEPGCAVLERGRRRHARARPAAFVAQAAARARSDRRAHGHVVFASRGRSAGSKWPPSRDRRVEAERALTRLRSREAAVRRASSRRSFVPPGAVSNTYGPALRGSTASSSTG